MQLNPDLQTSLLETETRFKLITSSIQGYILILDPLGRITYLNRAPLGTAPGQVLGKTFLRGLIPEAASIARQLFKACIQSGQPASYIVPGFRLDLTPGWFDVSLEPVLAEGKVHSVVVLAMDRTEAWGAEERIRCLTEALEERVRERTAQLEASTRELADVTYAIAHDLRTPLRGIDGFSKVLLEDYPDRLDERGRHYLSRIRQGAQRLGLMMESLLNLSGLDRGELEPVPVDLSALCRLILDHLGRAACFFFTLPEAQAWRVD